MQLLYKYVYVCIPCICMQVYLILIHIILHIIHNYTSVYAYTGVVLRVFILGVIWVIESYIYIYWVMWGFLVANSPKFC